MAHTEQFIPPEENPQYLRTQILTYIGNKRGLLPMIQRAVSDVAGELGKKKLSIADVFSGSGIVARALKPYASTLYANDLEEYSAILNRCYLANSTSFDRNLYNQLRDHILSESIRNPKPGVITETYSPKDTENPQKGERVFYSRENAIRIDTWRSLIETDVPVHMKDFFLAPLITEASIHVNTGGVFKGFYKDPATGIGAFGGHAHNALNRILGEVTLEEPVLSRYDCLSRVFQLDAYDFATHIAAEEGIIDIAYLDPPYNEHPYGSNYFMLNVIAQNKLPDNARLSRVSGIPDTWNRSDYNYPKTALASLEKVVAHLQARYLIVSYNSEGYISFDEMIGMLQKYGKVSTAATPHIAFKASRNLQNRNLYVNEYLFVLKKDI